MGTAARKMTKLLKEEGEMIIFRSHEDYSSYSMEKSVIAPDDSNNSGTKILS